MSDDKRPPDQKPQNQTDEDSGNVKRPQASEEPGDDLPRGSEGQTRRTSHMRR